MGSLGDEVLSPEETKLVLRELRNKNETYKVLTPRCVYTDKSDVVRTDRDVAIQASARLVVPGFRDVTSHTIRKDAPPTCCRTSQHLILIFTSCK